MADIYSALDENMKKPEMARHFIEDRLDELNQVDSQIKDLIEIRSKLVESIQMQSKGIQERVNVSEDWFEGEIRGHPRPAREYDTSEYVERDHRRG